MKGCLVAIVTVIVVVGIAFFAVNMMQRAAPRTTRPTPTRSVVIDTKILSCSDCESTGMPANVWLDKEMSRKICDIPWMTEVKVHEVSGGMARISQGGCAGWIRTSLLQ